MDWAWVTRVAFKGSGGSGDNRTIALSWTVGVPAVISEYTERTEKVHFSLKQETVVYNAHNTRSWKTNVYHDLLQVRTTLNKPRNQIKLKIAPFNGMMFQQYP